MACQDAKEPWSQQRTGRPGRAEPVALPPRGPDQAAEGGSSSSQNRPRQEPGLASAPGDLGRHPANTCPNKFPPLLFPLSSPISHFPHRPSARFSPGCWVYPGEMQNKTVV